MQQFSVVLHELRKWFQSLKWYPMIQAFELQLMFGGAGILFLKELLYLLLPYGSFDTLNLLFYTIPLSMLAYYAFLVGVWSSLVSANVKYVPYGLFSYAFIYLFPFTGMTLSSLIPAAVYALLGYAVFKYSASTAALK